MDSTIQVDNPPARASIGCQRELSEGHGAVAGRREAASPGDGVQWHQGMAGGLHIALHGRKRGEGSRSRGVRRDGGAGVCAEGREKDLGETERAW